jgi:proteasome accessory factor A
MKWDYGTENPHADMRGFEVEELRQDSDEAHYFHQDQQRALSFAEIKSDYVLSNGARFYNDHAHPEYCTPECSTLDELAAHDSAGERILSACARRLSEARGATVRLYKNNTDFGGHSYGCHENYLLPRSLPWRNLAARVQAFLVTRQIYAGAGKFGVEAENQFLSPGFQISQRADFFSELQSVDTMQRRPIVNTRDEPHANPRLYRRFHVILGDANMSSFATRLKTGATALALEAICLDPDANCPELDDPLRALREISRDTKFQWPVRLEEGRASTAIEVQRSYLSLVRRVCDLDPPGKRKAADDWETTLNLLESDYTRLRDRLDWVAKRGLLLEFQEARGLAPDDPWLRSLDLEYHRLDDEGLFRGLEMAGAISEIPDPARVTEAMTLPPATTRALIRGKCVAKFAPQILAAQWDHITLQGSGGPIVISLADLFAPDDIRQISRALDQAERPADLLAAARSGMSPALAKSMVRPL